MSDVPAVIEPRASTNPITIGELNNVPVPGSLIASGWAQDVSNRIIHRFADIPGRDAAWPATQGNKGAMCVTLDTMKVWQSTGLSWQLISDVTPVGTIRATIHASADAGWLVMDGTLTVNAATLYPELWGIIPASWKSGSSMLMPNMADRVPIGRGSLANGDFGGANSRAIGAGNLPPHSHSIDHDHPNVAAATDAQGSHQHGFSNNPTPGSTVGVLLACQAQPAQFSFGNGGTLQALASATVQPNIIDAAGSHAHNVNVDIPYFGGGSGNGPGAGTAFDTTPACLAITYQIKCV